MKRHGGLFLTLLACEAGPTGSIELFPEAAMSGGSPSAGATSSGATGGGGSSSSGGRTSGAGSNAGGSGGVARGGAGTSGAAARAGSSSGGASSKCNATSCTNDDPCFAPNPHCNLYLHLCCICGDDSQCSGTQHCELTEGHCE